VGLWSKRSKLLARKRSEHQVKARQHQRGDRGPGPNLPAQSSPQIKEHESEFSGCSSHFPSLGFSYFFCVAGLLIYLYSSCNYSCITFFIFFLKKITHISLKLLPTISPKLQAKFNVSPKTKIPFINFF
jgi:hypothetical protein